MINITKLYEICQEEIDSISIFSFPIAISPDLRRSDRILNREWKRIGENDSLANQAQLQDILSLIGNEYYSHRLKNGFDTNKEDLWLAAFGITEGDRSSGINTKRPGKPSGILQIDVDHYSKEQSALYAIQDKLLELPFIIATFISPSQNGVKALAVLDKPRDFEHAKAMGIACTKVVCDHLDLPGYREGTSKASETNYKLLPLDMQEKYGQAHIDFSVANDPRKGCFIPVKESHLLLKEGEVYRFCEEDNSGSLTGWYYQGVTHPWFVQQTCDKSPTTPHIQIKSQKGRPAKEESDWQKYVNGALNSAFDEFESAPSGNHHQAAITLGRCIKKFLPYIDNMEELYARADSIIDSWSPKANSPLTEKKTVRDMQVYNDSMDKELWLENKRAEKEVQKQAQQEEQRKKGKDEVQNVAEYVDFKEEQPEYSKQWGKDAVMTLLVKSFLSRYRFTPKGNCYELATLRIYEDKESKDLFTHKWTYLDENNKQRYISLQESMDIIGTAYGEFYALPINRPDLPTKYLGVCKPDLLHSNKRLCINISNGIPTLNLELSELITPSTIQEAKTVCDFIVTRFIDNYNYSKENILKIAQKEAAYYFKFISQAIVDPVHKWQCALGLLSPETGTGKSTITVDIPTILAPGLAKEIRPSSLENDGARRWIWSEFEGALFVAFDDFKDQQKSFAAALRNQISSKGLTIERKGEKSKDVYNYSRIMLTSNDREFLKELNSGVGRERRYHLFSCRNIMVGDHSCDAAMHIIEKYKLLLQGEQTEVEIKELMAFRAALILEMQKRVQQQEDLYGEINMQKPLESAEFKKQAQISLEHNKVARIAGNILVNERDNTLSIKELYNQIREKMRKPELSDKYILDRMKESGWFSQLRTTNARWWRFSEEGIKMFIDYDEEEVKKENDEPLTAIPLAAQAESIIEQINNLKNYSTREQYETLRCLCDTNLIECEWLSDRKVDITIPESKQVIHYEVVDNNTHKTESINNNAELYYIDPMKEEPCWNKPITQRYLN